MVLSAVGGCLAALGLLAPAHAQTPSSGGGEQKLRVLSVSAPPLADAHLPEGGLVLALVNASLARLEPGAPAKVDVQWSQGDLTEQTLSNPAVDLFLPVESANCDRPSELTQALAVICDHTLYSEPILQVVVGLFTLTTSSFKFETEDSILGKTVCISREQDLASLNANGRNWVAYKRVTVLRRATQLDCVVAVQAHEADAFTAIDLEGAYQLKRLGLSPYFVMQPRPLATRGVHAVIGREHPRAPEILGAFNRGLKLLKQDAYAGIVQKHLVAGVSEAKPKQPAPASPQAVAAPQPPAPKPVVPPAPPPRIAAVPPAAPPAVAPQPVPVLDKATRERALRYVKRGDEELAEGRIAPARLLYERAAEMGLAQAAMALAATYDARELNKPHLITIPPDPSEAKRWYERAHKLGAAEAATRLQRLGSSSR